MSERKAEPKPNVLERLSGYLKSFGPRERSMIALLVADAMAEIERKNAWQEVAMQEIHDLTAQLRAITEAEPAAWQERNFCEDLGWTKWRYSKDGPEPPYYAGTPSYEVRRLIVAPKVESDGA